MTTEEKTEPTRTQSKPARTQRPTVVGIVSSDKMQNTITVREERLVKHPRYGKYVRRYTKYKADDPTNDARIGDKVEIVMTRPLSKSKCWRLIRVIDRAPEA